MKNILNQDGSLNVQKLDNVVESFYTTKNPNAEKILCEFKKHPNTWKKIPEICQVSKSEYTKFLTIDIMRDIVKLKWAVLPLEEKKGMKNYIMKNISQLSQVKLGSPLIGRYNLVLVEIIKKSWPQNWKTVIPELVKASQANEKFCENGMQILRMLSEDVFEFAEGTLTSSKKEILKKSLLHEFKQIFNLCKFVFLKSSRPSLVQNTLKTLGCYLLWVPLEWVLKTDLMEIILKKLLHNASRNQPQGPQQQPLPNNFKLYRVEIFKCLQVLASVNQMQYNDVLLQIFTTALQIAVREMNPRKTNFAQLYGRLCPRDQKFVFTFTYFLATFLKTHLKQVEKDPQVVNVAHLYLVNISRVRGDKELFKVCMDYWNFFVKDVYFDEQQAKTGLLLTNKSYMSTRKAFYKNLLAQLREIIVYNMAKPEEVIIIEGSDGELMKEYVRNVDAIEMYKTMRFTLMHLMRLDGYAVQKMMIKNLKEQLINDNLFTWRRLNCLCWSIGSVAGVLPKGQESKFLVMILRDLLELCRRKTGRNHKAVIASNIMYVVQKYPRFLTLNWQFLKTVTMKLFEFMNEKFQGVQEMACETFLQISMEVKKQYIQMQKGEKRPFIFDLLANIQSVIKELEGQDIYVFFRAVAEIVDHADPKQHQMMMKQLMKIPNGEWIKVMQSGQMRSMEAMQSLKGIIRTNRFVAMNSHRSFVFQMKFLFSDLMSLYKFLSQEINKTVAAASTTMIQRGGNMKAKHFGVKKMRDTKEEILSLFETFISKAHVDLRPFIYSNFLAKFVTLILQDYCDSRPDCRDANVLGVVSIMVLKYKNHKNLLLNLPVILEKCFRSTLPLITKDFKNFPEHRIKLFRLIRTVNSHCFQTFFEIQAQGFSTVMKSILWAIRHKERDNYEEGLNILNEMVAKIRQLNSQTITNTFFGNYFIPMINDMTCVLTDTFHQTLIDTQCQIMQNLFFVIAHDVVSVKIYNNPTCQSNNKVYLRDYFGNLLAKNFKNLNKRQIGDFTVALFKSCSNRQIFTKLLKDFLVQMKETTNQNAYQEFQKKRMLAIEAKRAQERIPALPASGQEQMMLMGGGGGGGGGNRSNDMMMDEEDDDEPMISLPGPGSMMNMGNNNNNNNMNMGNNGNQAPMALPMPMGMGGNMGDTNMMDDEPLVGLDDDSDDDEPLAITNFAHNPGQ